MRRHDTIAHAVRVMRGPYGGPLFASLVWPYQTGYSSEAIDIPYVVSPKKGAYSKYIIPSSPPPPYSAGACAACVLLDLFSIEPSPLHVKCNMESPPTAYLRPAAGPPHGEAGRRPALAPRERTREGATGEGGCHQRWPRQWATTHGPGWRARGRRVYSPAGCPCGARRGGTTTRGRTMPSMLGCLVVVLLLVGVGSGCGWGSASCSTGWHRPSTGVGRSRRRGD